LLLDANFSFYRIGMAGRSRKTRRNRTTKKQRRQFSRRLKGGQKNFSVHYGSKKVAGQHLTKQETAKQPLLNIPAGYYVLMYDPDAGKPNWIHWIASAEKITMPYQGPAPPPNTGLHKYTFLLLHGKPPPPPKERGGHDVSGFLDKAEAVTEFIVNAASVL
jgi:phosphatidylethanolamine-binding protein (PEBP) family uncharacterized protein